MIRIRTQVIVWLLLYCFWVWVSMGFHPTFEIDLIVTALLTIFYAAAIYINELLVLPRLAPQRVTTSSIAAQLIVQVVLTFAVLGLIRLTYWQLGYGEYLGDYWEHYCIDLLGMTVHVIAARILVSQLRKG